MFIIINIIKYTLILSNENHDSHNYDIMNLVYILLMIGCGRNVDFISHRECGEIRHSSVLMVVSTF